MRRKDDTLRDTLLELCRETAEREGAEAVNIRSLAQRAGVATGTVYNYFSSKDDLLLALTEEYWRGALAEMASAGISGPFCRQVEAIFLFLGERLHRSAGALMGSLSRVESAGRERMAAMQAALERDLLVRLAGDPRVREDLWDETFTRERFIRFVLMNMMALWEAEKPDPAAFFAVLKQTLYGGGNIDGTSDRGDPL